MAIQTTANLSNSVRAMYIQNYLDAAEMERLYDQFSQPVGKTGVEQAARMGTSYVVPFLSDMTPGTDAISQVSDITPQILKDATASVTPTSRGEALEWAEALEIYAYTDYGSKRFKALGKNQMETVDILAKDVALQGDLVVRYAARASLDAGTSGCRLTDTVISKMDNMLLTLKCPAYIGNGRKQWMALMHPSTFYDLRLGGNMVTVALYQNKEIIFNNELAQLGNFKLVVSPFAKVFWNQAAVNTTAVGTTLSAAAEALDKTITVTANTNMAVGGYLNIVDTAETGDTHVATNERVWITDISSTTITIVGEGANGGLRFDHASGVSVANADSVYPVLYGSPTSLAKLYDTGTGEFGDVVGPKKSGRADQFTTIAWKYYGGYGRWVESWLVRGEYCTSLEA